METVKLTGKSLGLVKTLLREEIARIRATQERHERDGFDGASEATSMWLKRVWAMGIDEATGALEDLGAK